MYYVDRGRPEHGFSLTEVLVALLVTSLIMSSVFLLLGRSQSAFAREPEVSDTIANARAGLSRISADLMMAGFNTPPNLAVMWNDGGAGPDELTIIFADPDVPVSRPKQCATGGGNGRSNTSGGGPCNTIGTSSTLNLDPYSMEPAPRDYEKAYSEGMILYAIQGPNGDPACDDVAPAIIPFEVTQPPNCTGAGGAQSGPAGCATLNVNHNPGQGATEINPPNGFDNDVSVECAVVGLFHVVQYRINPLPPTTRPDLERRDLSIGEDWSPVAGNVENLQVQYGQGADNQFRDEPLGPISGDPDTWVTQVRITVSGRSKTANLEGSSRGAFDDGAHLRRAYTTTMSLRNQLYQALDLSMAPGSSSWN